MLAKHFVPSHEGKTALRFHAALTSRFCKLGYCILVGLLCAASTRSAEATIITGYRRSYGQSPAPGEVLPANARFRLWFGGTDVVMFSLVDAQEREVPVAVTTTPLPEYLFRQSILRPLKPLSPGGYTLIAEETAHKFTVSSRLDTTPPAAPPSLTAQIEQREYRALFPSKEMLKSSVLSVRFEAARDDLTPAASLAYVVTWTPLVDGKPDRRRSNRSSELLDKSPDPLNKLDADGELSFSLREVFKVLKTEKNPDFAEASKQQTNSAPAPVIPGMMPGLGVPDDNSAQQQVARFPMRFVPEPILVELQAVDRAGNVGKAAKFTLSLEGVPAEALKFYPMVEEPFVPPMQINQANDLARFKEAAASTEARAALDMLAPLPATSTKAVEVAGHFQAFLNAAYSSHPKAILDAAFKREVLAHDRTVFFHALLLGLQKPVPIGFVVQVRGGKVEPGLTLPEMQSLLQALREVEPLATVQNLTFNRWNFKETRALEVALALQNSDAQMQGHEIKEEWTPAEPAALRDAVEQRSRRILSQLEKSRNSTLHQELTKHFGKSQLGSFHEGFTSFYWPERGIESSPQGSLNFHFHYRSDEISSISFEGNLAAFSVGTLENPLRTAQAQLKLSQEDALKTRAHGWIEPDGKLRLSFYLLGKINHQFSGALNSDQIEAVPIPPSN